MCVHEHLGMLLLSQDGIVGLEVITFEELLSTSDLEVKKGISNTKNGVSHRGRDGEE